MVVGIDPDKAALSADTRAMDAIATLLGTSERWSVGFLECIADIVGEVRPHPGVAIEDETYRDAFHAAMHRDVDSDWDHTDDNC